MQNNFSPSAFGMNIERQSSYRRMRNSHSVNGYYAEEVNVGIISRVVSFIKPAASIRLCHFQPIRRSGSLYVDSEFNIANSDPSDISFRFIREI